MPRKTVKNPQTVGEMMISAEENKKKSNLYKVENTEFQDERISAIVTKAMAELARVAVTNEKIRLADTALLKEHTLIYMRVCAENAAMPSWSGLMRSLGHSSQSGYLFRKKNPNHPSSEWLEMFSDAVGDVLAESASRNLTNTVFSIFLAKAKLGWKETFSIEAVDNSYCEHRLSPEEISQKYSALPEE